MHLKSQLAAILTCIGVMSVSGAAMAAMSLPYTSPNPLKEWRFQKHVYGYSSFSVNSGGIGTMHVLFSSQYAMTLGVAYCFYDKAGQYLGFAEKDFISPSKTTFPLGRTQLETAFDVPISVLRDKWADVDMVTVFWHRQKDLSVGTFCVNSDADRLNPSLAGYWFYQF